ncbi:hypothetical protein EV361DRAFT_949936 [Lentinula raphanica]|nr:hypothetical protein EV361DRAFT_949936 [Lentinula raphanica]
MLHRSNWLATVFGASLFIAAVAALPFDKSEQLSNATSTDVSMAHLAASIVPEVSKLSKRQLPHGQEWYGQLDETDWIVFDKKEERPEDCYGYGTNQETFMQHDCERSEATEFMQGG